MFPSGRKAVFNWGLVASIFMCCVFWLALTSAALGQELTFHQALAQVLSSNESALVVQVERDQREFEQKAARGLYLPKVTLSGRWTRIDGEITMDLNPIRDVILAMHPLVPPAMVPSFETQIQDETFFKSQLNVVWPVYTGGRITAANRAAEAGVRQAEEKGRSTRQGLTIDLVRRYYGVRLSRQVELIRSKTLDVMSQHLHQARRLEQEGMIAKTERLHAEVAHAEAERNQKAAARDVDIAQAALRNILTVDDEVDPTSPLFLVRDLEPLDVFLRATEQNHPVLGQLEAGREMAHQNLKAEESRYAPEFYLFGMRELNEGDLTSTEPKWAMGVGVNFTLFEGFVRPNKVQAARKLEDQVRLTQGKAARDLQTLINTRYQQLMKAREQFDSLDAALALARENVRARQRGFQEGMATSLDVVDAQLSLSAAQVQRLQAAYNYDVALAELLEASGRAETFPNYVDRAITEVEQ